MKSSAKILEWTLNGLAIVIVLFMLQAFLHRGKESADLLKRGSTLAVTGVDWADHKATLVIAVQPGCRFCTASAGFYADILRSTPTQAVHIVAMSPSPTIELQTYLRSLDLSIPELRQADFNKLGVQATPTLILVDSQGRVASHWIGKLTTNEEDDVFKVMGIHRPVVGAPDRGIPVAER